jgi:hypothetical protein
VAGATIRRRALIPWARPVLGCAGPDSDGRYWQALARLFSKLHRCLGRPQLRIGNVSAWRVPRKDFGNVPTARSDHHLQEGVGDARARPAEEGARRIHFTRRVGIAPADASCR